MGENRPGPNFSAYKDEKQPDIDARLKKCKNFLADESHQQEDFKDRLAEIKEYVEFLQQQARTARPPFNITLLRSVEASIEIHEKRLRKANAVSDFNDDTAPLAIIHRKRGLPMSPSKDLIPYELADLEKLSIVSPPKKTLEAKTHLSHQHEEAYTYGTAQSKPHNARQESKFERERNKPVPPREDPMRFTHWAHKFAEEEEELAQANSFRVVQHFYDLELPTKIGDPYYVLPLPERYHAWEMLYARLKYLANYITTRARGNDGLEDNFRVVTGYIERGKARETHVLRPLEHRFLRGQTTELLDLVRPVDITIKDYGLIERYAQPPPRAKVRVNANGEEIGSDEEESNTRAPPQREVYKAIYYLEGHAGIFEYRLRQLFFHYYNRRHEDNCERVFEIDPEALCSQNGEQITLSVEVVHNIIRRLALERQFEYVYLY